MIIIIIFYYRYQRKDCDTESVKSLKSPGKQNIPSLEFSKFCFSLQIFKLFEKFWGEIEKSKNHEVFGKECSFNNVFFCNMLCFF